MNRRFCDERKKALAEGEGFFTVCLEPVESWDG